MNYNLVESWKYEAKLEMGINGYSDEEIANAIKLYPESDLSVIEWADEHNLSYHLAAALLECERMLVDYCRDWDE